MTPKPTPGLRLRRRRVPSVQLAMIGMILGFGLLISFVGRRGLDDFAPPVSEQRLVVALVCVAVGACLGTVGYVIGRRLGVLLPHPPSALAQLAPAERRSLWRRFRRSEPLQPTEVAILAAWVHDGRRQNVSAWWSVAAFIVGLGGGAIALPGVFGVILPLAYVGLALFLAVITRIERARYARVDRLVASGIADRLS